MKINIKNDRLPIKKKRRSLAYLDISGKGVWETNNNKNYKIGTYQINKGDRLAQLVIVPIWTPELEPVEDFESETARGEKGFGSSGTR